MTDDIKRISSPTHKWGVLVTCPSTGEWITVGFMRTERAATQHAIATGRDFFMVARRFTQREARNTRAGRPN